MKFFKNILEKQKQPRESKNVEKKYRNEYQINNQLQNNPQENRKVISDIERDCVNDPGADELDGGVKIDDGQGFVSGEKVNGYVDVENAIDERDNVIIENEDGFEEKMHSIELQTDEALEELREKISSQEDVYGFVDILSKVYNGIKNDKSLNSKQRKGKMRHFLYKINDFLTEYNNILNKNLSDNKEYKEAQKAFKRIIGTVVYSSDGKVDVFPNRYIKVQNKKAPRSAILVKEEKKKKFKTKHYKKFNNNRNSYKVYNPVIGKKEDL